MHLDSQGHPETILEFTISAQGRPLLHVTNWTRVVVLLFPWSVVCITVATGISKCLLFYFTVQRL